MWHVQVPDFKKVDGCQIVLIYMNFLDCVCVCVRTHAHVWMGAYVHVHMSVKNIFMYGLLSSGLWCHVVL